MILLFSLLILDAAGQRIELPSLGGLMVLISVSLAALARRRGTLTRPEIQVNFRALSLGKLETWMAVPIALGLGAIVLRAVVDPLSGFDTVFRWDFLARQILRHGTLDFYPPVSAEDFERYAWCDGFAPLVSSLYLWTYLCLGHPSAVATAPVVVAQAFLIGAGVWQLAARIGGGRAAVWAVALAASSAGLLWATAMGQESGLMTLAVLATLNFSLRASDDPEGHWPVWAGLAAGVGALTREYGLVLILLGLPLFLEDRLRARHRLSFIATFVVIAAPWHLRVWMKTGNPLFPHALGGLFPENPAQAEYFRAVAEIYDLHGKLDRATAILPALACIGLPSIMLGLAAAIRGNRECRLVILTAAAFVVLWWISIPYTSGGYAYSFRVLAPVFALGAALGGTVLARANAPDKSVVIKLALTLMVGDAAVRSLYLPIEPTCAWWGKSSAEWRQFNIEGEKWRRLPIWSAVSEAAGEHHVLVSDPLVHAILVRAGAKPVPLFSPQAVPAFSSEIGISRTIEALRRTGFRFVILTPLNPVESHWLARHPWFSRLRSLPSEFKGGLFVIHDLYSKRLLEAARELDRSAEQGTVP